MLRFAILFLFFCSLSAEEQEKRVLETPNPLSLKNDWFQFFNVPNGVLQDKIETFQENLETQLSFLEDEDHEEILKSQREIIFNLKLYKKQKDQLSVKEKPKLQFLKEYSPSELMKVNQELNVVTTEIARLEDKISFEKSKLTRMQNLLDREILKYGELAQSSNERLFTGLKIIEHRVEVAIHRLEIDYMINKINYLREQKKLLNQELEFARKTLSVENISSESLTETKGLLSSRIKKAQEELEKLEKEHLRTEDKGVESELLCCLWNYQIITKSIEIENLRIQNAIKQLLEIISNPEEKDSAEAFASWSKKIESAKESASQWQKRLTNDHSQISKVIAKSMTDGEQLPNEEKEIADVHFELDQSFALLEELKINISATEQFLKVLQSKIVEKKSLSETWLLQLKRYYTSTLDTFNEQVSHTLFYVKEHPVTIWTLLKALFTFIFALIISKYLRYILASKVLVGQRFTKSTRYIILRFLHYGVIILALLMALNIIGLDMTNLAIVAGALGVGIGFGLQNMVNNVLSGFTLLLNRYINVGDIVEMGKGEFATVQAVNLQFTHVQTFEGADVIIPNAELSASGLTNWTMRNQYRRFSVPFGVAYGTDKDKLEEVVLEKVNTLNFILKNYKPYPNAHIRFASYGDSAMNFELIAWVDLRISTAHGIPVSAILWEIDNALSENGIEVPFPQRDLHLKEIPPSIKEAPTPSNLE